METLAGWVKSHLTNAEKNSVNVTMLKYVQEKLSSIAKHDNTFVLIMWPGLVAMVACSTAKYNAQWQSHLCITSVMYS